MNFKLLKTKLYEEIINDFNKNKAVYMFYLSPIIFKLKTKDFKNYKYSLFSKIKNKELAEFKNYKLKKYLKKDYEKDLKTIIKIIFKSDYIDENNKYALHYIKKLVKRPSKLCYINLIYRLLTDINKKTGGMMGMPKISIPFYTKKSDKETIKEQPQEDEKTIKKLLKVKHLKQFIGIDEEMRKNIEMIKAKYSTIFYNPFNKDTINTHIRNYLTVFFGYEVIKLYNKIIVLYNTDIIKNIRDKLNYNGIKLLNEYSSNFEERKDAILNIKTSDSFEKYSDEINYMNIFNERHIDIYNNIITVYNIGFNTKKKNLYYLLFNDNRALDTLKYQSERDFICNRFKYKFFDSLINDNDILKQISPDADANKQIINKYIISNRLEPTDDDLFKIYNESIINHNRDIIKQSNYNVFILLMYEKHLLYKQLDTIDNINEFNTKILEFNKIKLIQNINIYLLRLPRSYEDFDFIDYKLKILDQLDIFYKNYNIEYRFANSTGKLVSVYKSYIADIKTNYKNIVKMYNKLLLNEIIIEDTADITDTYNHKLTHIDDNDAHYNNIILEYNNTFQNIFIINVIDNYNNIILEYNGMQLLLYKNEKKYNSYLNKIKDAFNYLKTKSQTEFEAITNTNVPKETINITTSSDINNFIINMYNNFILKHINNAFKFRSVDYFKILNNRDNIDIYNGEVSGYNRDYLPTELRTRRENYIIKLLGGNGELNNYKLQFLLAEIYKRIKIIEC